MAYKGTKRGQRLKDGGGVGSEKVGPGGGALLTGQTVEEDRTRNKRGGRMGKRTGGIKGTIKTNTNLGGDCESIRR